MLSSAPSADAIRERRSRSMCGATPASMRRTCVCEMPTVPASWRVLRPAAIRNRRSSSPARRNRYPARLAPRWAADCQVGMATVSGRPIISGLSEPGTPRSSKRRPKGANRPGYPAISAVQPSFGTSPVPLCGRTVIQPLLGTWRCSKGVEPPRPGRPSDRDDRGGRDASTRRRPP